MSANVSISLYFFYTEASIRNLDAFRLYRHVQLTTARLGIATPARAHVRKVGEKVVYIEHLSCNHIVRSRISLLLAPHVLSFEPGTQEAGASHRDGRRIKKHGAWAVI
jgi:hypothetical protein